MGARVRAVKKHRTFLSLDSAGSEVTGGTILPSPNRYELLVGQKKKLSFCVSFVLCKYKHHKMSGTVFLSLLCIFANTS